MLRRIQSAPTVWWAWGCIAIFVSGALTLRVVPESWSFALGYGLATLYPALLLAGARRYAAASVSHPILLVAFAAGLLRGFAELAGEPALSHGLALALEPLLVVAAAVVVSRADTHGPPSVAQRLLTPALLAIGVLEVASAVAMLSGAALPLELAGAWICGAPVLLAIQLAAWSEISRRDLERARQVLEQRVTEQTERYRAVSELSTDFSFSCRVEPGGAVHFDWITDAVSEITGYEPEEVEGRGWVRMLHPEDRVRFEDELFRMFRSPERDSIDTRIVRADGEVRWINLRFGAVRDVSDGTFHVVGAARDVTDRVRAEEESRRLDQRMREMQRLESLGRLAGGIAHDFNNVLTVILGNARLALEEPGRGEADRTRLQRIRAAAEYAAGLTEQVLTYSGKASVALEPVDLTALAEGLLDLLRASVSKKVRIEAYLQPGLPEVEGDVTQLRQLLLNLVLNASDALGEEGGLVRIRTGTRGVDAEDLAEAIGGDGLEPGHYVYLEVRDDGAGMPPEVRARIFDPFFTTKASGRGLGLAVVLGIVRAHRGAIRIETAPQRGTLFEILLPRAARRRGAAPSRVEKPERENATAAGASVLLVDDDEAVLEVGAEFLRRAGFQVHTASGGREALALLREHGDGIDAVVLDLVMPDLSGEETFLALRELHPDLPVVLASGYDREQAALRFSARGIADFLRKPYEPEDLVISLRRLLP